MMVVIIPGGKFQFFFCGINRFEKSGDRDFCIRSREDEVSVLVFGEDGEEVEDIQVGRITIEFFLGRDSIIESEIEFLFWLLSDRVRFWLSSMVDIQKGVKVIKGRILSKKGLNEPEKRFERQRSDGVLLENLKKFERE